MAEIRSKARELELVLSIWRRRKWLAIPLFLIPLAALVSLVMSLPSVYQATATILVEGQQLPESLVRSTVTNEIEARVRSMSRDVLSDSRLSDLVERFGLRQDTESREAAIERARAAISVETKSTTSLVSRKGPSPITLSVSYDSPDPQTAAHVANTLASFFVEENFKVRDRLAGGTTEFLKAQLEQTRMELAEQEKQIGAFRTQHLGELPQQMQANLLTLERFDAALRLNTDNQLRVTQRRDALEADLAALAASDGGSVASAPGTPEGDVRRLFQLRQQLLQLQTRFTDKYPDVIDTKAEIAAIEDRLAKAASLPPKPSESGPTVPFNPHGIRLRQSLAEAEVELDGLKIEERRLRDMLATYQSRVENTPKREQEFQQISRDYQTTQDLYQSLLKRLNEAQLSETMEQSQKGEQFRLVSPASPPSHPAKPRRPRLLMMALLLPLALAGAAVAGAEYLDSSFHTVDDLRRFTTLPILTIIPRIVTDGDVRQRRFASRLRVLGTALSVVLSVAAAYFIAHDNWSLLSLVSQ